MLKTIDPLEDLKKSKEIFDDLEKFQSAQRDSLRNFAVSLREAGDPLPQGPASFSNPSFAIGEVKDFPGVTEPQPREPVSGHMEKQDYSKMLDHLKSAAEQPDPAARDAKATEAAKEVSQSWAKQNDSNPQPGFVKEARAQVAFAVSEIAQSAGLAEPQAKVVGFAFERALEKEGFKVIASHAIEKVATLADSYKQSSSSAALATGNQAQAESMLNKSLDWLADKGITKDTLQKAVKEHAGKFQVVALAASNPETVQEVARTIAKSDSVLDGIIAIKNDSELRKAVGNLTMAAGEAATSVSKGVGSATIVAGAALKGESVDEVGRHAFRAGLSILGGAAGGIAAGSVSAGFGAVAGAAAGQYIGDKVADKLLEVYDKVTGNDSTMKGPLVSKNEVVDSSKLVASRAADAGADKVADTIKDTAKTFHMPDRSAGMSR